MSDEHMTEGMSVQPKLYELGYLLAPLIASEAVAQEVSRITEILGQDIKAEGAPVMRRLAYTISKKINATTHEFEDAYFGWIKFEATPERVVAIKKELEKIDLLVRYLLIHTALTDADLAQPADEEVKEKDEKGGTETKDGADALDQEIDQLLEKGDL